MIGKKLKELRENRGLLQRDIAEYLEMSQRGYSQWEGDLTEPSIEKLKKLAAYYNVPVSFFYGEEINCPVDPIRKLINELIEQKIIVDPNDISGPIADLIIKAIQQDLIMQQLRINNKQG